MGKVYISSYQENGIKKWGLFFNDQKDEKQALKINFKPLFYDTREETEKKLIIIEDEYKRERDAIPLTIEEAKEFAAKHTWKFAKTYAKTAPHEYIVKNWLSEEDQLLFERFVQTINEKAVTGYFYSHKNNYFILGEHYYWYMDYPDNMAVDLINRTTVSFLEYSDGNYRFSEKALEKYLNGLDRTEGQP